MIDQQLAETVAFIRKSSKVVPRAGFILGSGLSGFAKRVKVECELAFKDLPHFAVSTVEGHPGKLVLGHVDDLPVAVMLGRLHAYEGLDWTQVIYPVRVLATLGIQSLVVTNAAGGLKAKMKAGDFMVIKDVLNMTGDNPLRGPNWNKGPRFVDMTEPFDGKLSKALKDALKAEKVRHHEGVYVGVLGPTYETAAEIKFYAKMGGGSVGMSTVAEVIAARHLGLKVAGLSCITNLGTGLSKHKLSHEEVKEVANRVEDAFTRTLVTFIRKAKPML